MRGETRRISYVRNEERLGMVLNWRKAFELARERHPDMEYFAWASDHDVWHPRWLSQLVAVLDAEPQVVMSYPFNVGIDDEGNVIKEPWEFDTFGITDLRERLALTSDQMAAGNMVYSLFRADALDSCGIYRLVLLPDRLLMTELALRGQFKQVPETLWFRRYRPDVKASYVRQRASFFPDGAPLYSFLPWSLMHTAAVGWSLVVRGDRPPGIGRSESIGLSGLYLTVAVRYQVRRWFRRRMKATRTLLFKRALPSLARPIGGRRAPHIVSNAATRRRRPPGMEHAPRRSAFARSSESRARPPPRSAANGLDSPRKRTVRRRASTRRRRRRQPRRRTGRRSRSRSATASRPAHSPLACSSPRTASASSSRASTSA